MHRPTRRDVVAGSLLLGSGYALPPASARRPATSPIVETSSGRVRGTGDGGAKAFKGIVYGRFAGRFLPALPVQPWSGVRDAIDFGPQAFQSLWSQADIDKLPAVPRAYRGVALPMATHERSEASFTLNVWTPSTGRTARLPVMVWLHGGGFSVGSSAASCTDGAHLAQRENVVVVSLNHRLNIFGHLYLGQVGDDRFAASGNAGLLDIVLALQWVRDNIAAFGGDPGNVTLFGVSGGGGKIAALFAMPAALPLFHKAIIQSGPYLKAISPDAAAETTRRVLAALDIGANPIDALAAVPAERLHAAFDEISGLSNGPPWLSDWRTWDRLFAPVRDGRSLVADPFDPDGRRLWSHVPLLIGHSKDELYSAFDATFDGAEVVRRLTQLGFTGDRGRALLEEFRRLRPAETVVEHLYAIAGNRLCDDKVDQQTRLAALREGAPTYAYLFSAGLSLPGVRPKTLHALDVPFCFDTVDAAPGDLSPMLDRTGRPLSTRMRGAWAEFARTGRPAHRDLPAWPAYDLGRPSRMVLGDTCRLVDDDDAESRLIARFLS